MPPRSSWKGFLRLSLVSVPVKAYTANSTGGEIRLNQLHETCHNRVKYKKVCPDHGEVTNDEIVSGYEFSKGQYVVIDLDEMSKLRAESDKAVRIEGFMAQDEIDPVFHAGRTHYLVPDGPVGQKPYVLLRDAMIEENLCALGQVIISGREQLVLIRAYDGLLLMTGLNYANRVKKPEAFRDEIVESDVTTEEAKLTKTLMDASRLEDVDLETYKDDYTGKLTTLIQSKVEGKEIVAVPDPEEPQIINLMEALKASVAKAQTGSSSTSKMAPSTTKRSATAAAGKAKKKSAKKTTKKAAKKKAPRRKSG